MRRRGTIVLCGPVPLGLLALVLVGHPVRAELYVAGQVGYTHGDDLSSVQGTGAFAGLSGSDLEVHGSVVYGGKVGYYLPKREWFGIESEVFHSIPHVKQQSFTVSGPGGR